jgi:hypothetical protein
MQAINKKDIDDEKIQSWINRNWIYRDHSP